MNKTNFTCSGTARAAAETPADVKDMQTALPEARVLAGLPAQESAANASRPSAAIDGDVIYVANAGLVLLHPFLPRMFRQLQVLSDDTNGKPRIAGTDDASRAVHLLQWLVDAHCDTPEPSLALNKLLCGLELDTPVAPAIVPGEDEIALCWQLLAAVTGNWSSIGNTSADGLRETFLQRDGRLQRRDGKWTLTVSRKTVDVLVDQIPWGFAVILHPWMSRELAVMW
ncbi:contractile injection system tape measure protein [Janthinobacterium sp. J1-1]|uniref:contractile injection system tape measure protein n=1 Tax=Janthinobacterium sp. J1-1 TaxID=3065910 RepID=UPI00281103C0|nr:contractile injection system tape measure protein [Janthinobacterium sp. J1-1]